MCGVLLQESLLSTPTMVPDAKLYIQILDTNLTIEPLVLVKILTYIIQHDSYALINLNMGIIECD